VANIIISPLIRRCRHCGAASPETDGQFFFSFPNRELCLQPEVTLQIVEELAELLYGHSYCAAKLRRYDEALSNVQEGISLKPKKIAFFFWVPRSAPWRAAGRWFISGFREILESAAPHHGS
jgi:hypothetical protein